MASDNAENELFVKKVKVSGDCGIQGRETIKTGNTYVLKSRDDNEQFEADEFHQRLAASEVVPELALKSNHSNDGPDGSDELEHLELC